MSKYTVKIVTRPFHSYEVNGYYSLFDSLEQASHYIQKQMRIEFQANGWDTEWDIFQFDGKPRPDISRVGSIKRLQKLLMDKDKLIRVWGPYSSFEAQRPFEILISENTSH